MKQLFRIFSIIWLLCIASCKSSDLTEPNTQEQGNISDFALLVESFPVYIGVGKTDILQVRTDPPMIYLDGAKFRLETSKNTEPDNLSLEFSGEAPDGHYNFRIKDSRTEFKEFDYELKIVYSSDITVETKPFRIRSAEEKNVSKVYITLDDGNTRASDLDTKTTTISGYNDDGSNFENQVKYDNRVWIGATIRIDGGGGFADLETCTAKIKGRGNSTWSWAKKPYNLKLDKKAEILGMKMSKRWCLIANAIDRTNMRCWLAYRIASLLPFDYSVSNEFVELYFMQDGKEDYRGLYLLTEHIKEDRLQLTEQEESAKDIAGDQIGYLLEFDMNYDEPGRFLTCPSRLPVNIKYPALEDWQDVGNMEQYKVYQDYISEYVSNIDQLICNIGNGRIDNASELWEKLDIVSMASQWIVFEVMCSREILWPKSVYFYKDVGAKLKAGPAWDFDYRTLNSADTDKWVNYPNATAADVTKQYWAKKPNRTWWAQLISRDNKFRDEVKKQWNSLYPKLEEIIRTEIDACKALIKEADVRNATIANDGKGWKSSSFIIGVNEDADMTFNDAVKCLKKNFENRIKWLNNQINSWK